MTLHIPKMNGHTILVDAVQTKLGWLSFALTHLGLRRSTYMYDSEAEALIQLQNQLACSPQESCKQTRQCEAILNTWKQHFVNRISGDAPPRTKVPIDDTDWTPFAKRVYGTLMKIPYGKTITYGEIASAVGSPGAARAVGALMKNNPIPPIVPCHRVTGANGKLGGFSANGGPPLKSILLQREGLDSNRFLH